jgi:hypothetical protein
MNKRQILVATACFASLSGTIYAQSAEKTASFQYFVTSDTAPANVMYRLRLDGLGGKVVKDKPFSATEERETVQVLGDGTRIDKKETDKYFRDAQGRTRIERDNGATIVISDPVAGFSAELNENSKTAHKMIVQMRSGGGAVGGAMTAQPNILMMDKMKAEMGASRGIAGAAGPAETMVFTRSVSRAGEPENSPSEDLGTQIVNGVPAQGTRSTITIPVGQIGNDREIRVISERWFSPDLQMLIKSSNNDPRFGETTYQLVNVIQGAQDASLFQIPSDFSVNGPR